MSDRLSLPRNVPTTAGQENAVRKCHVYISSAVNVFDS
jgi:hypothetical protein